MEVTVRPIFFPRIPLMKPRTLWACQEVASMISVRVAPFFRCSKAMTLAVLLPWRGPSAFDSADFLGALVAFFAWVVFWADLGLAGCNASAALCATRRAGLAEGAFGRSEERRVGEEVR